jgi:Tfp pilus assembly pilus retraction ATPase PilT
MRLQEIEFSDLYFSEAGDAFVRGIADASGPLVAVPEIFLADLQRLHRLVCEQGQKESEFRVDYDEVPYRCSQIVSVKEIWYALRRPKTPIPRLSELKLPVQAVQHLAWLGNRSGLILIAGATGGGKTTTACSLLQEYLRSYGNVAVTVEDPPELPLEGDYPPHGRCFQLKVTNGDFGTQMRKTMRYMPKYILLGEVRDPAAASQALEAAINGHLVITTVHAGSAIEALQRLLQIAAKAGDLELARSILSEGLAAVMFQKLRRTRAPNGSVHVSIQPQFLFTGFEAKVRTKIRDGKFETLKDDIEQQSNKMARGEQPVPTTEVTRGQLAGRGGKK